MPHQASAVARARDAIKNAKQKQPMQSPQRGSGMPVSTFYFWAYDMK